MRDDKNVTIEKQRGVRGHVLIVHLPRAVYWRTAVKFKLYSMVSSMVVPVFLEQIKR